MPPCTFPSISLVHSKNTALVHQLFVIATSINFTAPLLLGALLDAYGPRVCSVLSLALVTAGFVLFSFSSPERHLALPSIVLIAFGGPGVQSSIIHLSNLYPTSKATITSIITGYVMCSVTLNIDLALGFGPTMMMMLMKSH